MTAKPPRPPFALLDALADLDDPAAALDARQLPAFLRSHEDGAQHYVPGDDLKDAIHVALAIGAPLLLTGEPGTGKTQAAYYIARQFGIALFPLHVRSDHGAEDLLYRFDAVAYLHAANDPARRGAPIDKQAFIERGPLWQAYEHERTSVVLIDEIDKAHRDFPNDLLNVLDQHAFHCRETDRRIDRGQRPPPIVVITSNRESRLPEPFLRRCVFHHIPLTPQLVRDAVAAHTATAFPRLDAGVRERALQRFWELRDQPLRKPPATAELLVWLAVLAARADLSARDLDGELHALPALSTLVKDHDDELILGKPEPGAA